MNFVKHNEEVKEVWAAYRAGKPLRVPMILGLSSRLYLLDDAINENGITYKEYLDNPRIMLETQCRFRDYIRHNLPHDIEMGLPEDGWTISIDWQNVFDAGWFGAEVTFPEGQCPDTHRLYEEDSRKWELLSKPAPEPFDGLMGRAREFYEYCIAQKGTYEYKGRPVKKVDCAFPTITDGPFTLGCQLRGAEQFCCDMLMDPDYFHQVMDYLTTALIRRGAAWREYLGMPAKDETTFFADDFIELISTPNYVEHVMPYHRRIYEAWGDERSERSIHLCGNVMKHLPTIRRDLGVTHFDTGFPIDFAKIRQDLGPEVEIMGGPHIELILNGSEDEVRRASKAVLTSGIKEGKRFIFREGNNLAPKTPPANVSALYESCREWGGYAS